MLIFLCSLKAKENIAKSVREKGDYYMPNFTKQAIKASFMKLLNEHPLSKISVRSIVEDCGINRNSFYYHYQDITDLIEEIIKEEADALIIKYPCISSLKECVDVAFKFALENKKAVMHIYNSVNRDIYERSSMKLCEYVVTRYIDTVFADEQISLYDRNAAIRFFKCELYGLAVDWIRSGMKDDAIEEIYRIVEICRGMSEELIKRSRNCRGESIFSENAKPV